jgi:sirohydrochlorin cobaltochelatase
LKTQLVLFAHGSRDPRWRAPFLKLLDHLRGHEGEESVALAFMEFAPPTLVDVAKHADARGIGRLRLLPLFLAGGAHVAKDIPEQVGWVKEALPSLEVEVLPPIGEDPRFESLLREITREALRQSRPAD